MLNKDAPQLFARRIRDQVLEDTQLSERECHDDADDDRGVAMEIRNRLGQLRKATIQAVNELSVAALDTGREGVCENEPPTPEIQGGNEQAGGETTGEDGQTQECENEPPPWHWDPRRVT